jgi:histone deacetylase complex regulatory component SIN3
MPPREVLQLRVDADAARSRQHQDAAARALEAQVARRQAAALPQVAAQRPKTRPQKRRRATLDDNAPPSKRSSRGKPKKNTQLDDAYAYVDLVKKELHTKGYSTFLAILIDFKAKKITLPGVVRRVSALFKGHPRRPELARGFNIFLPAGCRVESSSPGEVVMIDDSDDDDGFEMLETRTAEERVEAARARAEQQGDVVTLE